VCGNRAKLRGICDDHQKEILIKNCFLKRRPRTGKTDVSFVNYFTTYFVYHIEDSSIFKMAYLLLSKKGGVEKTRRYI
jgi:hypothetical protein